MISKTKNKYGLNPTSKQLRSCNPQLVKEGLRPSIMTQHLDYAIKS